MAVCFQRGASLQTLTKEPELDVPVIEEESGAVLVRDDLAELLQVELSAFAQP